MHLATNAFRFNIQGTSWLWFTGSFEVILLIEIVKSESVSVCGAASPCLTIKLFF